MNWKDNICIDILLLIMIQLTSYFNLTRISQLQRRDFRIKYNVRLIESEGDH